MTRSSLPGNVNLFVEPRRQLVTWVRQQLTGAPPTLTAEEQVLRGVLPTERFPCGAIYPITSSGEGIDPASDSFDEIVDAEDETEGRPVISRRYVPPSSLGVSFYIRGEHICLQLICSAAAYMKTDAGWERYSLASNADGEEYINVTCPDKGQHQTFTKLSEHARIDALWRRFADGWIVTVSLSNAQAIDDGVKDYFIDRAKRTLYEAKLRCVIDSGEVGVYPGVDRSLLDEEEQEIELQYAGKHIFAIGHGCAANWIQDAGRVSEIGTETMPAVEVPQMTSDTGSSEDRALWLSELSDLDNNYERLLPIISTFIDGYAGWAQEQEESLVSLPEYDLEAGRRITKRVSSCIARMREGLRLLQNNKQIRLAFSLANLAMLDQMRQTDRVRGGSKPTTSYRWRPFQLAFLLTVLESTANEDSEYRDTVDLIWFPTGGGKTEAYLGQIAFQIILRRLRHASTGGGTCVLMRYTLRLLTRDQFLRATKLICALELIRRARQDLGDSSQTMSIGMWVGGASSPNSFADARKLVTDARSNGASPSIVLNRCPWCGHLFDNEYSYDCSARHFRFRCANSACAFHAQVPCNVVDEALYKDPPTLLLATVDKFARLAWEPRANSFFGGEAHRPPELIIQDELHLIAGALGSVAGLYEAALDTVIKSRGVYPKYVASTATIRTATRQIKSLYGREVAVFPPPGLSVEDSYFARSVPLSQRPGRIYVGYLAPMLTRQQCIAPLAAALLLSPFSLFEESEEKQVLMDAWWTQVVYHGSLKGVGNTHTSFVSSIAEFMKLLNVQAERRSLPNIAQLTSLQSADENSKIFSRLSLSNSDEGCLDAVLATNMVSVGLDVARLALMIINGQPLTTAEYIQSSSRVGRSEVPGIVFANYYRDQARSLSHYESFRPYHDAFYRFVEPTSVTPFTYQARQRALHAALVIVMRHGAGLLDNNSAASFNSSSDQVCKAIVKLKRRCIQAVSGKAQQAEVEQHIDNLVIAWENEIERCRLACRALKYQVADREMADDRLLYNHTDRIPGLWATLQSMRNVENTAYMRVGW